MATQQRPAAAMKGRPVPFPLKLYDLMMDPNHDYSDSIRWLPEGGGFEVHNSALFEARPLPKITTNFEVEWYSIGYRQE